MRHCPECGQSVKDENLVRHLERVHPTASRQQVEMLGLRRPPARRAASRSRTPFVAVLLVLVVAASILLGIPALKPASAGRFSTDHTYWAFGHVPQGVSSHTFTFSNTGSGDLVLSGMWTSCGCTSARVVIDGQESPRFGMHNNPRWTGRLAAGGTATIIVEYDALTHPDLYVGERSAFLRTDDPSHPEVEFRVAVSEV